MENSKNTHPQPGADPGADIETVIPSPEHEVARPGDKDPQTETERNDQSSQQDADPLESTDPIDYETNDTETDEGDEDTDEHGIETVTP